jgi:hypothetical protein
VVQGGGADRTASKAARLSRARLILA